MPVRMHVRLCACAYTYAFVRVCNRVCLCAPVVRPCALASVCVRPCALACVRMRPCALACVRMRPFACVSLCALCNRVCLCVPVVRPCAR